MNITVKDIIKIKQTLSQHSFHRIDTRRKRIISISNILLQEWEMTPDIFTHI